MPYHHAQLTKAPWHSTSVSLLLLFSGSGTEPSGPLKAPGVGLALQAFIPHAALIPHLKILLQSEVLAA